MADQARRAATGPSGPASRARRLTRWYRGAAPTLEALAAAAEHPGLGHGPRDHQLAAFADLLAAVDACEALTPPPDPTVAAHLAEALTLFRHAARRGAVAAAHQDSAARAAALRARRHAGHALAVAVAPVAAAAEPATAGHSAVVWAV